MVAKLDWSLIWTVFASLIANLIGVGIVLWKLAEGKTRLVVRIERIEKDINDGLDSVREGSKRDFDDLGRFITYKNKQQDAEIRHISRHLEETSNYRHPTFNDFDSNDSRR